MMLNRVAWASLLAASGACMSTKQVQPAQYIPQFKPALVWVTYTDNSYVPVSKPQMVGDTLKGVWEGMQEPVAIPMNQIQSVQAKLKDPKKTVILFTTLSAVTGAVLYTFFTAGTSGDPGFNGCPRVKGTPLPDC